MADWDTAEAGYANELMSRAGAGAPATLGEIWNANWHATALDTLTGSGQPLEDSFNKLVDVATARLGPLPQAARNAGLDWLGARGFEGKALVIQKLAGGLPADQQKELEPLLDFRTRAAETATKLERDAADVNGRAYGLSGVATGWLAGVSRQMVDPVNLAIAPVTGGEGGLLASTAKLALTAGVAQAVQEPVIQRNRGELGLDSGLGAAAGDVANVVGGTAALGLGLPLLFRGAAWMGRRAFGGPEPVRPPPVPPAPPPERLALPAPWHFPVQDEPMITPYYPAITAAIDAGRSLVARLEGERGTALPVVDPHTYRLISEEAALRERDQHLANNAGPVPVGARTAAELLTRVQEVERQAAAATGAERKALLERRDELLSNTTPDMLEHLAAPVEQRRVAEAERANIAARLEAIASEKARKRAEQLGGPPAIALGETTPVRRVVPHDSTLEAFHSVAPGDLEAAALLADRDVVIGPHGPAADAGAARAERGDALPPRIIPPEAFPAPRSRTRFEVEPSAPAAAAEAPAAAAATKAESAAIAKKRGPAARPPETWSLFEFLAKRGGLAPHPDLAAVLGGNPFVPGFGRLIRKTGMTLDRAREAAVEAGYLHDQGAIEGRVTESTTNQLLDVIDAESRGQRRYREGNELTGRKGELEAQAEQQRADLERHIDAELEDAGIRPGEVDPALRARVTEIMTREGVTDPLVAFERAVMENTEREAPNVRREETNEIPGWDADDAGATPAPGEPAAGGGQAAPREGSPPGGAAARRPGEEGGQAGLGNPQLAADAERALEDAGGDFTVTLVDPVTGASREVSARQALAEAEEEAAAARELAACIGGVLEEDT